MAPKSGRKTIFRKIASRLCRYPRSILLHFRDKHVFVFNAEIQVTQKFKKAAKSGRKNFQKIASRFCRYPVGQKFCQNCSNTLRFRNKRVFAFNTEIQDGRQKWPRNSFLVKVTSTLATYPARKNFVEIALSHSVTEINRFLRLTQKFKMAAKSGGKTIFAKSRQ